MTATSDNIFLRQLNPQKDDEEDNQQENVFLKQLKEAPLPKKEQRAIDFGKALQEKPIEFTKAAPRHLMQGAIGAAKGAIYRNPITATGAIGLDILGPAAAQNELREQIASESDYPEIIRKALSFESPVGQSEIDYETAQKGMQKARQDLLGQEDSVAGGLSALPFRLAGIETAPQTGLESGTRNVTELITGFGGPKNFTSLVFDYLPSSLKNYFRDKMGLLEEKLIGSEPLPKSIYESAEKALAELNTQEKSHIQKTIPKEIPRPQAQQGSQPESLHGRVSLAGEDIGLRPPPSPHKETLENEVGRIFSPTVFHNSTQGGQSIKNLVTNLDEAAYRNVNRLYQKSRELNQNISEIHPQLVNQLSDRLTELRRIPEPSGPQKQLISALENIIDELAVMQDGVASGYKPISNQILIDQVQSLRQKVDYDFAHGDAKNIFKPTINDIQNAARNAAAQSGNSEALESFDQARSAYRDWVNTFDSDYLRPIRNIQNKDYSKIFKGSLDLDEFNQLRPILEQDPQGVLISDALKREIVDKHLKKHFDKPIQSTLKDFNKDLRELEAIITPEQAQEVRNTFLEAKRQKPSTFEAKKIPKLEETVAKYANKKPEDISDMFEKRSGIKEIRSELDKSQRGKELYDQLKRQKVRDILREGQIEKDFSGNDLYKALNNRKNFELLSELIGEQETEAARLAAKELGKKKMTTEAAKSLGKHALSIKFIKFIFPLL